MRQLRLPILLAVTVLASAEIAGAQGGDPADSSEYLIKAGFIYNFAKLVEWPGPAFGSSSAPIVIGVLGDDAVADVIEGTVKGKKMENRPFVVRRLKWSRDFNCACQILFITAREASRTDEILQSHRSSSVLTIAEAPGLAKRGVVINFVLENSQVRFEANVGAARQAGLNVSSRLLSLATIVQTETSAR